MTNARRRRQIRRHRFDGYPPFEHNAAVQRIKARKSRYRAMVQAAQRAARSMRAAGRAFASIATHVNTPRQEHR